MKKAFSLGVCVLLSMIVTLPALAIDRQSLASYASALNGKKKAELKTAIYNIIKNHGVLSYGSGVGATWYGFYDTDRDKNTYECINRYSPRKFYFDTHNTGAAISGMNIEHSFPKSWWGKTKNNAYKDLFNLYPSESAANSDKSNYPMGVVTNVDHEEEGYDKIGTGTIDGKSGVNCWEPGDQYKGDFSRAYMYMATCYQNLTWQGTQGLQQLQNDDWPTLKQWAYTLYLQWIKADPVDQLEVDRNEAVSVIQKNRNLFVDYPYLAEYVWGDSVNVAFNPYSSISTAEDDDRYLSSVPVSVSKPTFSPDGGTFTEPVTVEISCATPSVTIYYTTDGSSPLTNGTRYTAALTISETTTLKAVARDLDGNYSHVATALFAFYTTSSDFYESFDQCSSKVGGNDGDFQNASSSAATFKPDNAGWVSNKYFGALRCAKFGASEAPGVVTTPAFTVNGTSTFSFKAAPWTGDGNSLTLSVSGKAKLSINGGALQSEISLTMKQKEWTEFVVTITGNGPVSVTFTPTKRFFLDEVMAVSESMAGDVNKDGRVDISDVTALIDIVLGKDSTQPYDHDAADVNDDGKTDISDVTSLIDIILGKE